MKKRIYRTVAIKNVDVARLVREAAGARVLVAIDVAKADMVAAVAVRGLGVLATVHWKNPDENAELIELVRQLQQAGLEVEGAMEPSGTYGDVLRHQLLEHGLAVLRVTGNRTHDAAELYDGVPSLHDAKSAAIIAKLHFDGLSRAWTAATAERRGLQAAISVMQLHQEQHLRLVHQLESWLARHWPELTTILELTSAMLLALLARIGGLARCSVTVDRAFDLVDRGLEFGEHIGELFRACRVRSPGGGVHGAGAKRCVQDRRHSL